MGTLELTILTILTILPRETPGVWSKNPLGPPHLLRMLGFQGPKLTIL
jgi:hypothetical protein